MLNVLSLDLVVNGFYQFLLINKTLNIKTVNIIVIFEKEKNKTYTLVHAGNMSTYIIQSILLWKL